MFAVSALLEGHLLSLRGRWKEASKLFDLVLLLGAPSWHALAHAALANAPVEDAMQNGEEGVLEWPRDEPTRLPPALDRWPRLMEYHQLPSLNDFETKHLLPSVPCIFKGEAKKDTDLPS